MKDHVYVDEEGKRTPISQLSTADIQEHLREGVEVHETAEPGTTVQDVIKRLRLELFIRREGLR